MKVWLESKRKGDWRFPQLSWKLDSQCLKVVYSSETCWISQCNIPEDQVFKTWTALQDTPSQSHSLGMCELHNAVDVS
jgi:hypothetical protein